MKRNIEVASVTPEVLQKLPKAHGEKERLLSVDDIVFAAILTLTAGLLANL